MRVSLSWLADYVDIQGLGPDFIASLLTDRGLEVEAVERQDQGFDKVVVGEIIEKAKHPQADRLSLCQVVIEKGKEPLRIVCGAQNMKAGDKVAVAQVGALLPNGLKIKKGNIRGEDSFGMLCSEEELGLADTSEGIMILSPKAGLGKPVAQVLGRDDTVLTLSITPNRGDCLSYVGVAREVAAATQRELKFPKVPRLTANKSCKFGTRLDAGDGSPQFWGAWMEGVKIGPSPDWMVARLEAAGSRSINNVVDATNYVLFELGQPMHAYDGDRLSGECLSVRQARPGEHLPLLDDTEVTLEGFELVIADGEKPVALAGVMGGGNSQVQDGTTNLMLECAEFAPSMVRRSATKHQKHSDSSHRFERGINPDGLNRALSRLAALIQEVAGGKVVGTTVAAAPERNPQKGAPKTIIPIAPESVEDVLGLSLTKARIEQIFKSLGCKIDKGKVLWKVEVPSYRWDLSIREDLIEEIARSVGYDEIPSTMPYLSTAPSPRLGDENQTRLKKIDATKDSMVRQGFHEALTYSFGNRGWLAKFGIKEGLIPLQNPMSEEHEVMVPSLIPGLLSGALYNWNHHFGSESLPLRLFELRPTFRKPAEDAGESVHARSKMTTGVEETWHLSMVLSGHSLASQMKSEERGVDFRDLRAAVEELFFDLDVRGARIVEPRQAPTGNGEWFHPGMCAEVWVGKDRAGYLGRIHPGLEARLKLKHEVWMVDLNWDLLNKMARHGTMQRQYAAWDEFPGIERDFALLVKKGTKSDKITQLAVRSGKPMAKVVKVFDIYEGDPVPEGMTSVAVRVIFSEKGRSLQEAEADTVSQKILATWKKELGAELRG